MDAMDAMARPKLSRLRRYSKRAAIGVVSLIGVVVLAVVGVLFSLRFTAVRGYVVTRVNGALAGSFKGRIVLHQIGSVGLGGISATDAEIFDPAGHRVVDAHGLSAELNVPTLVWAALTGKSQPLMIRFSSVDLKHAEVVLIDNGTGVPTLADTFLPKTPSTPSTPSSGPGVIVSIEHAGVNHVWAHGSLGGSPPLDVELKKALATFRLDNVQIAIEIKHTGLVARGLPQRVHPLGDLRGSLNIPAAPDKALSAHAHYAGTAAAIPVVLDASYVDSNLKAHLEAKNVPPAAVAQQVPGLELRSPATLSAAAEGKLPDLHGTFALGLGAGKVDGDFKLSLQDDTRLDANVRTQDVDLAELSRSAPNSSLNLTLHAGLIAPQMGSIKGNFELHNESSVISAQQLPKLSANGSFESDPQAQRNRVEAHVEIAEPGAETGIDASLLQTKTTAIEFRTTTHLSNPPRLRTLAGLNSVQGELTTLGKYQVESQALNAKVNADLRGVRQGENRVDHLKLSATVSGKLPNPTADVRLDAEDAESSGQHISGARLALRGSLSRLAVSGEIATRAPERHLQISAYVSNDHGIVVDHPIVDLQQGATHLRVSAEAVCVVNGRTSVRSLHLEGAGKADISLVYGSTLENMDAQTDKLDLAKLWHLLDANAPLKSGTATSSASYERPAGKPHLRLTAQSSDLTFGQISNGSLTADFELNQGSLDGTASADLKQLGRANFELRKVRGIDLTNPNPARLTGSLTAKGQVKLNDLLEVVPKDVKLPIARALGSIQYDFAVERSQAGPGLPSLHLRVITHELELAGTRDTKTEIQTREQAVAAAPTSIKGYDVDLDVTHDKTGETELNLGVTDNRGRLVSASVKGKITAPMATVVDDLSKHWRDLPLSVNVSLPARRLQQLPMEVRPAGLDGLFTAELAYQGTLDAPDLKFSGKISKFRQVGTEGKAVDVALQALYSGTRGKVTGSMKSRDHDVATADIDFETALSEWLNQRGSMTPHVVASAHLGFDAFPIALLPPANDQELSGLLSGKLSLDNFGKDATADIKLDVKSLKLAKNDLGSVHVRATARGGKVDARLEVSGKGKTTAEAHAGLDWGARFVPELRMPADANLRARELRLSAFSPLLTSVFGDLDGRVNGDLNAHFRGGPPELDGHIDLQDGSVQVAAIGQRFDQITARLSLEPGKAKLEEMSARATTGKLHITGEARFSGLDLTGADAKLRIGNKERISISVNGQELDQTWGAIDLAVRPGEAKGSHALAVNMGEFHVHMPNTGSQTLQDLAPAEGVRVGTYQRDGSFVTLPLQPLRETDANRNANPMVVKLNLGNQLWVEQGDTTKVHLGGQLTMVLGEPMTMTGQIYVKGGQLDVSGKEFQIESGTVTFSDDPANPTIVATAVWDAADDEHHRVYADASGTASDLIVRLRSEPPLTQDQVLSLIVTGSADGSIAGGGQGSSTAGTAVGAVGGVATQGMNKALSNVSDLDVSTRIDTSTGTARPEVVIQLSPRVSAQITRALGAPAPGTPPDLTFLTLNFRLKLNWSLSALIGDRGESGLDLVWRKRY